MIVGSILSEFEVNSVLFGLRMTPTLRILTRFPGREEAAAAAKMSKARFWGDSGLGGSGGGDDDNNDDDEWSRHLGPSQYLSFTV